MEAIIVVLIIVQAWTVGYLCYINKMFNLMRMMVIEMSEAYDEVMGKENGEDEE